MQAAVLTGTTDLTREEIAEKVGAPLARVSAWRNDDEFRDLASSARKELFARIRDEGIAIQENRIAAQNTRWKLLQQIVRERAELFAGDEEARGKAEAAGVSTGWVTRSRRYFTGPAGLVSWWEYRVDTAMMREMAALEKLAGEELGQFINRTDITSKDERMGMLGVVIMPDNHRDEDLVKVGSSGHGEEGMVLRG